MRSPLKTLKKSRHPLTTNMLLLSLIVGLICYIIMKIQMISLELTWVRKYMVRLLTKESDGETLQSNKPESERDIDEFNLQHPIKSPSPSPPLGPTHTTEVLGVVMDNIINSTDGYESESGSVMSERVIEIDSAHREVESDHEKHETGDDDAITLEENSS